MPSTFSTGSTATSQNHVLVDGLLVFLASSRQLFMQISSITTSSAGKTMRNFSFQLEPSWAVSKISIC